MPELNKAITTVAELKRHWAFIPASSADRPPLSRLEDLKDEELVVDHVKGEVALPDRQSGQYVRYSLDSGAYLTSVILYPEQLQDLWDNGLTGTPPNEHQTWAAKYMRNRDLDADVYTGYDESDIAAIKVDGRFLVIGIRTGQIIDGLHGRPMTDGTQACQRACLIEAMSYSVTEGSSIRYGWELPVRGSMPKMALLEMASEFAFARRDSDEFAGLERERAPRNPKVDYTSEQHMAFYRAGSTLATVAKAQSGDVLYRGLPSDDYQSYDVVTVRYELGRKRYVQALDARSGEQTELLLDENEVIGIRPFDKRPASTLDRLDVPFNDKTTALDQIRKEREVPQDVMQIPGMYILEPHPEFVRDANHSSAFTRGLEAPTPWELT